MPVKDLFSFWLQSLKEYITVQTKPTVRHTFFIFFCNFCLVRAVRAGHRAIKFSYCFKLTVSVSRISVFPVSLRTFVWNFSWNLIRGFLCARLFLSILFIPLAGIAMLKVNAARNVTCNKNIIVWNGDYTRLRSRLRVRFRKQFQAWFWNKSDRDQIIHLTPITMFCLHILEKKQKKNSCLHIWQEIVHNIVCWFVCKIAQIDVQFRDRFSAQCGMHNLVFNKNLFWSGCNGAWSAADSASRSAVRASCSGCWPKGAPPATLPKRPIFSSYPMFIINSSNLWHAQTTSFSQGH
jgi:hypothetical protein